MAATQANQELQPQENLQGESIGPEMREYIEGEIYQEQAETSFTTAPAYVMDYIKTLIKEHHSHLEKAKIMVVFREARWVSKGRNVYGRTKTMSPELKTAYDVDFVMTLNRKIFEDAEPRIKLAILDAELCRCDYKENNSTGEITWKINSPDIEGHIKNITRFGFWADELSQAEAGYKQTSLEFDSKDQE